MPIASRLLALLALAALLAQPQPSSAQGSAPSTQTEKLVTPEASLNLRMISNLQFSPDGARLAFVVTEPPKGTTRLTHIWLYDAKSGQTRQLTYSGKSETFPRWSPDGSQLAFLSNREGANQQIYILHMNGGEAQPITKGKRSVKRFEWSPDGKLIAFLAPDPKTDAEEKKEKDKDDARVVDKDDKHDRLWVVNLANDEAKALTPETWQLDELAWLPHGDTVVFIGTDTPAVEQYTNKIMMADLATGHAREVSFPHGPYGRLYVVPDGRNISYIASRDDGPDPHDLFLEDLNSHAARNLTGLSLDRAIMDYHWRKDGSVLLLAANGFSQILTSYSHTGERKDLSLSPVPAGNFQVSDAGAIAYVSQSATEPQELWIWDQKSAPRQISHLNDSWKQYALSAPEYYKYKSFDEKEIEAALLKPRGYDGKSKLPLIALIHGGPTGRWSSSIETWGQLLATHGYAVFYPNIRGSIGYGQDFIASNRGDWGGGDFKDVMAGVKDLVDRGIADPNRLAIGGWSYGGYMAEWAITQTNDFKAAVSGAGMANLISEFGTEDHPEGDEWFYGVPWEKPEGFLNSSPFVHLMDAKTPTLVLQGDADTIDPLGQSQELYRGLKRYKTGSEMVVYPREPHGFHEERHLVDRLNRILAWYDKYLKGAPVTEPAKPAQPTGPASMSR